ncbi:hypothetical protein KKF92_03425 [Patescibacteria group bacterium]|nr:hypothetical protein [Patescibacteria group bacterium]
MIDVEVPQKQELLIKQEPRPVVTPEVLPQEPVLQQRRFIDIESFYQAEVARHQVEQTQQSQKTWEVIEKTATSIEKPVSKIEKPQERPRSISDKIHRQILLVQARLEGIKDLNRFLELADYFESTVYEYQHKQVEVPKGLKDEQKRRILKEWKKKGWQGEIYHIDENQTGKHAKLSLDRSVPLKLEQKHIELIKGLISTNNHPVELAEGLVKIGFWFSDYMLKSPDYMAKLEEFFSAPHAKGVLELAQNISWWGNDWFSQKNATYGKVVEVGQIEFLTQLAQNPDLDTVFSLDLVQKINTLSTALNIQVSVAEIGQLQIILNNPNYLEFVAYLSKFVILPSNYKRNIPIFENIIALDQAGILKLIVDLYRSGVSLGYASKYDYLGGKPTLGTLFDSYEAEQKPQEVRQEAVQYLQEVLSQPHIQKFLSDTQSREFVELLAEIRGSPITVDELSNLNELFGEDLAKGKSAIYILKSLQRIYQDIEKFSIDLKTLSSMVSNHDVMEIFTDEDFLKFLEILKTKAGYKPSNFDLYYEGKSHIAEIFVNPTIRQNFIRDSTTVVIRALGGNFNAFNPEFYIQLGNHPNMVSIINAMESIGCNLSDSFMLPNVETFETIANDPTALSKLESPELKALTIRLMQEFGWQVDAKEIINLLEIFDDKELQQQLFNPENSDFIKKVQSNKICLPDIKRILNIDHPRRELMVSLIDQFNFYPIFAKFEIKDQQTLLDALSQDDALKTKLFSKQTQEVFKILSENFGYHNLQLKDIKIIVNTPVDFHDFIGKLQQTYHYAFQNSDLMPLLQLSASHEGYLDLLVIHGYKFRADDIKNLSHLIPHMESLPKLLSTVSQVQASDDSYFQDERDIGPYVFKITDLPFLLQLEPVIDQLPTAVVILREVIKYSLTISDSHELTTFIESGYTKEQLIDAVQVYNQFIDQPSAKFNIGSIPAAIFIKDNKDVITRLASYNYKFNFHHIKLLKSLTESPDRDHIFQVLDILRDNLGFTFNPNLFQYYAQLAQFPGIEEKLKEARNSLKEEDLMPENNFKLFVALSADVQLYNHAKKLFSDDYFSNIRDAHNRIGQFNKSILNGEIPDEVLTKIFSISQKATELDRLALKYLINARIAAVAQITDWQNQLLQSANFQEANEILTSMMVDLAIPVIYSDLEQEKLATKQNELIELAKADREFDDILEINCRAVGIFGQSFSSQSPQFGILMDAIRQSLELNLERNPQAYLEKRAELSEHQFNRIFEGIPPEVRSRVMRTWLDLTPRRRLRVNGNVITSEESTTHRLKRIKDIVQSDLSIHLRELFSAKIKELEARIEKENASDSEAEQLKIYKRYLMTLEGVIRQDLPNIYRAVMTFIKDAQTKLKNPETPREEKGKLGKSLGTYQGISVILKALYKLGTISEDKFKAQRDYLNEIDKLVGEFFSALKRLGIIDPERRSTDANTRALEEEVLSDLDKLKSTMSEESVSGQTVFETETTVAFRNLARAPDITLSCQRLTEPTGHNHAAYSRLLDGSNEMIDIFEIRHGERNRLARSFVELSQVRLSGDNQPRLAILIDREYVNPQYQNFSEHFSSEMILHMVDRILNTPELSIIFNTHRFTARADVLKVLESRGYHIKPISGEYFINESNLKLKKYYDSLGGSIDVAEPSWTSFDNFFIIEKAT